MGLWWLSFKGGTTVIVRAETLVHARLLAAADEVPGLTSSTLAFSIPDQDKGGVNVVFGTVLARQSPDPHAKAWRHVCRPPRPTSRKGRAESARRHAADLGPVIKAVQAAGATSLRGIAKALNERGVPTATGDEALTPQLLDRDDISRPA
jgi:hypothetical protein